MPFLMSPTIIAVIIAALLQAATLGWGLVQSNRADRNEAKLITCQAQHEAFASQTRAQAQIAQANAKNEEAKNAKRADETAKGWAAALDVVRSDAQRQRLRDASRRSPGGSGVSAPVEDRPGNAQADANAIPAPERIATDCAETTLTANFLQSYIERIEGGLP